MVANNSKLFISAKKSRLRERGFLECQESSKKNICMMFVTCKVGSILMHAVDLELNQNLQVFQYPVSGMQTSKT